MPKIKKQKILVAMSGGVDSSVAAALLVAQGYDVTGAFMVNYQASPSRLRPTSSDEAFTGRSEAETCWTGDYQDALRVAAKLGIPLMRLNFVKEYKKTVLDYMYEEYRKGRTPNPDVLCNKFVKFGFWLDKARALGFEYMATGHYARLRPDLTQPSPHRRGFDDSFSFEEKVRMRSGIRLMEAKDTNKDQTYFLHQLNQEQLKYVLFPIGEYTKPEVRKLAKKFNLPNADKEESMGICFVGEVPMKEFLQKEIKSKPGKIILSAGEEIGKHDGLPFYTIGQRSMGVKTDSNKPLYVVDKNFSKNELIVGYEDDPLLYKKTAEVSEVNWVGGKAPKLPLNCEARLRHRQPLQKAKVEREKEKVIVKFAKPQRAVTPGQFAVFYIARSSSGGAKAGKKGECLGGGVIN